MKSSLKNCEKILECSDNLVEEIKTLSQEKNRKIKSLTEDLKKHINLLNISEKNLQNAREEILKLSKMVKKEKPTVEELKTEKCYKTDLKKLVNSKRKRRK